MTSRRPGRLTGSKRVPWLGNMDFKIYMTYLMLPIWHARQWQKLGEPCFQFQLIQAKKISLGFSIFNIPQGTIAKALVGRMFDTSDLWP